MGRAVDPRWATGRRTGVWHPRRSRRASGRCRRLHHGLPDHDPHRPASRGPASVAMTRWPGWQAGTWLADSSATPVSFSGAAVGFLLGLGVDLMLRGLAWNRRATLADRLWPYLEDAPRPSRLLSTSPAQ